MSILIFYMLLGFGGMFLSTLCLKPNRRPFGSVIILITGAGVLLLSVIFMGPHFTGLISSLPFVAAGGLGAVLFFYNRRPSA